MQVQTAPVVESEAEMYARIFRELRPRTAAPRVEVTFCRFANANSFIRLEDGVLHVRISDLLQDAPRSVVEALAYILLSKLFRRPVGRAHSDRYRRYLNRQEVRRTLDLVRRTRGRKFLSGPLGKYFNLEEIFEELNFVHFHGLMARPALGWSRLASRTTLGHYDPSHHAIILSRILDRPEVPKLVVEYVMFHEMLHLRFPVEHRGSRRCVHTQEFREAENTFPRVSLAKELLRQLSES